MSSTPQHWRIETDADRIAWLIFDLHGSGTNTLGFVTTANRAIWIGPEVVVPAAQYVYHLSNVSSATANAANVDSVPVTLLLTQ